MTPDELRDHAAAIIVDHTRDIERMSVREYLWDQGIADTGDDVDAIHELIQRAQLAVDFP